MKKLLVYADFDWLKSGIEMATLIKQVFTTPFEKVETSTIKRKLRVEGTCRIKEMEPRS